MQSSRLLLVNGIWASQGFFSVLDYAKIIKILPIRNEISKIFAFLRGINLRDHRKKENARTNHKTSVNIKKSLNSHVAGDPMDTKYS